MEDECGCMVCFCRMNVSVVCLWRMNLGVQFIYG